MPRYAAIDIGSNSVRMLAAEVRPGAAPVILASERQVTRLGQSVFTTGRISAEAMNLTCEVLSRMAQTVQGLDVLAVRAVATAAVRDASNQAMFLEQASAAARTPVEIISGQEEARLIFLGVQSRWPHPRGRVLLVDVGGGSAELILSEDGRLTEAFSKPLGAVRLTEVFLKSDPPEAVELHRMEEYIRQKINPALRRFGGAPFLRAVATSATAAAGVCAINRVPRTERETADRLRATASQVRRFYRTISAMSVAGRRKIPGIGPRRAEILVAGIAVFLQVMEDFRLPSLHYSAAGVRDGVIADLAARGVGQELSRLDRDQRRSVEQMARRFGVDLAHARKVASIARGLFDCLAPLHRLPPGHGKLLEAAAYLHDTGHYVSDTGHHKHSAYLVANADLPGFTAEERRMIALLCRFHRKSMPSAKHLPFQELEPCRRQSLLLTIPLLRLADSLDRSHAQRVEAVQCQLQDGSVRVLLRSEADTDLELWAGERAAEIFRQIYQVPVALERIR